MLKKNRLFTPGPTPLLPQAQLAMASYGAHHRTAEFRALFTRVLADVKEFIGTKNDVLVLTSSGTGFMEASVSNLTSPGDHVLVLTAGKFGERWVALAKAFGCEVETVTAPYGETFSLDDVRRKLTPEIRCVYMQATESSTGVRHDVEAIAKLVHASSGAQPDTLLVVDAITGLGTTRLDVDGWGIDIILGGSQKALMIPPGLSYGAVSERAWQRMEHTSSPRYYFDLRKERKSAAKAETSSTPATALFAGLAAALDYVRQMGDGSLAAGRDALIANAELCAAMTRVGVEALGLKLFAPSSPSAALTAVAPVYVLLPDRVTTPAPLAVRPPAPLSVPVSVILFAAATEFAAWKVALPVRLMAAAELHCAIAPTVAVPKLTATPVPERPGRFSTRPTLPR